MGDPAAPQRENGSGQMIVSDIALFHFFFFFKKTKKRFYTCFYVPFFFLLVLFRHRFGLVGMAGRVQCIQQTK